MCKLECLICGTSCENVLEEALSQNPEVVEVKFTCTDCDSDQVLVFIEGSWEVDMM